MRTLWISLLALTATGQDPSQAPKRPPNIVFLMADDVGVEAFTCYGGEDSKTPHVDALAAAGMRFLQCHSQPLCTPSRVELLTGRDNAANYDAFSVLRQGERTVAHLLKDAGYATGVFGKWQLLAAEHYKEPIRGSGSTPGEAGFDTWCLWQVDKLGKRYAGPLVATPEGTRQYGKDRYGPDVYTDALLEFVTANRERPFFAYFPMALVHSPFEAPPGTEGKTPDARFRDMMTHMDGILGRIVEHLARTGLRDNTIVVFTGDNGTHRKIRSRWRGREVRGGKGTTTRWGTWVPLLVSWPGVTEAGSTSAALVDFVDFLPTLCAAGGAAIPADVQSRLHGESLVPTLRGADAKAHREVLTCWYHPRPKTRARSKPVMWAMTATHKLYGDGRAFDLVADPDEKAPLAEVGRDAATPWPALRTALDEVLRRAKR